MRDLSELGIKPYRRREPAFRAPSVDEIGRFEATFGVELPPDYVRFLHHYNGGRAGSINAFTTPSGYTCAVGRFYYLLPEDPERIDKRVHPNGWESGNLWAETKALRTAIISNMDLPGLHDVREQMTDRIVPFGCDNGNASQFVFDLRTPQTAVCLAIAERGFSLVALTRSFSEFIDSLHEF